MGASVDLPGHILKINRAHEHLEQLEREVVAWFEGDKNFTYSINPDPEKPTDFVVKASAVEIPITPISLIVGDVIHNIRSSLDYIAFELAAVHTQPLSEKQARQSQFPIIGDEDANGIAGAGPPRFANALSSQINCIDPKAQTLIESVQPYKLGSKFREHPLWRLNELSNIDKHRYLHVGAACIGELRVDGTDANAILGKRSIALKTLTGIRNDTVIANFYNVRPYDPNKPVKMNVTPKVSIAFSDGPLNKLLVLPTLTKIHTYVAKEVLIPLQQFL